MAKSSNNQSNSNAYWQQSPPPLPQDASTARERVDGTGAQANTGQASYTATTYSAPQYNTQQPQNPQGTPVYVGSKDHIAAGLLAFFLGSLGVHKFYLGYNTAGFIMLGVTIMGSLFTFGLAGAVMSLIGFIEGIIYLTKRQSEFDYIYVQNYKEWF